MRILVISSTPWDNNNSFGNTFSNFFSGLKNISFCNIYCKPGFPNNNLEMECFQISEKKLIKSIFDKKCSIGEAVDVKHISEKKEDDYFRGYDISRKLRLQVFFWFRDTIWKFGNWKSDDLLHFVDSFQPDIIFQPIYYYPYLNDIVLYLHDHLQIPMFGYISDDNYTLNKFNPSPLYWIDRLFCRRKVKKVIDRCEILYVISTIQKKEYEKIFNIPCKLLTKSADFSKEPPRNLYAEGTIFRMVYAGNLDSGRLWSIKQIINVVKEINQNSIRLLFNIYTPSPVPKHISTDLSRFGIQFHKAIPYRDLLEIQKDSHILVHVEGLSLKSQKEVHQSFSTKLVDYFSLAKCIFAVGTNYQASIHHLIQNDAAVVATNRKEIAEKLRWIISNPDQLQVYGKKAYACGRKHHDCSAMKKMLCEDLSKYGDIEFT